MFPEQLPLTLPEQRDTDHRIELVDGAKPPAHCIYRMTPKQEVELKQNIDEYLAAGQIEQLFLSAVEWIKPPLILLIDVFDQQCTALIDSRAGNNFVSYSVYFYLLYYVLIVLLDVRSKSFARKV